jgi:hypothetical protein
MHVTNGAAICTLSHSPRAHTGKRGRCGRFCWHLFVPVGETGPDSAEQLILDVLFRHLAAGSVITCDRTAYGVRRMAAR